MSVIHVPSLFWPHFRQVVRPPGEYSPATQWCSSLLSSARLVPSHSWPDVHVLHVVRVFTVPPLVYDDVWHVLQVAEAQLLNGR